LPFVFLCFPRFALVAHDACWPASGERS
jgi:hypothetical protein